MNKVISVNLHGNAYQLEEGGYDLLRVYLENAAAKLSSNPDREEIISDIERAMAEKFRVLLSAYKTVIATKEVTAVIAEIGPIDDGIDPAATPPPPPPHAARENTGDRDAFSSVPLPHRLYRLNEGAMFAGVCSGLAAHFKVDASLVRVIFIIVSSFTLGLGALVYLAMVLIVPVADTPIEKAAAQGPTATAQDFIRRAKEGYYEAMKNMPNKHERRALKRKFKRDLHVWSEGVKHDWQSNATQWQQNWHRYWSTHSPAGGSAWLAWPLLSVLNGLLLLGCAAGILALLTTRTIFGLPLPSHVPVWIGLVALVLIYQFISWPLKAARYYVFCGGPCGQFRHPPALFGGAFVWLIVLLVLGWLFYPQQTHEVIQNLPATVHHAVDTVQAWWTRRY